MALKLTRLVIALVLGLILAAHPFVTVSATSPAAKSCCCKGAHCCCDMACCVAPNAPSAPATPAPVPSTSQNELQVMAIPVVTLLTFPSPPANKYPWRFSSSASMAAVPLFQRDCCYLV
jgi:hypothetical protein